MGWGGAIVTLSRARFAARSRWLNTDRFADLGADRLAQLRHLGPGIGFELGKPLRQARHGEAVGLDPFLDLFPEQRGRDRRTGARARRIGGDRGRAAAVA